ncbi:putative transposase, Ptta/En/Spm, plant [Helianthus debilis subsp. tardiflorus]
MLHTVHMRKFDEREAIICNDFGQPIGPIRKGKDVAREFSRFLGTIARNHSYAPLIYSSWQKVPHKEKIWEYVLEKYNVPDAAKKWVLKSIGELYKVHKCRLKKKKHFYQFKDNKTRWKNRPKDIPKADFSRLLRLWSNEDVAKRCLRAKESRMCQKNMHTAGPKSFARIREEMKNDDLNQELLTLT